MNPFWNPLSGWLSGSYSREAADIKETIHEEAEESEGVEETIDGGGTKAHKAVAGESEHAQELENDQTDEPSGVSAQKSGQSEEAAQIEEEHDETSGQLDEDGEVPFLRGGVV